MAYNPYLQGIVFVIQSEFGAHRGALSQGAGGAPGRGAGGERRRYRSEERGRINVSVAEPQGRRAGKVPSTGADYG
jgi:hypothetical protein